MDYMKPKYHKKRKKSARSHFYRTKNDMRRRLQANKENHDMLITPPDSYSVALPQHWQKNSPSHYCKMEGDSNGVFQITKSIVIDSTRTWSMYLGDKRIPNTCKVLSRFQSSVDTDKDIAELIRCVDRAVLCPGNPEEEFVTTCKLKGGEIKGARGLGDTVAYIDNSPAVDAGGKLYQCTVRRVDCDVLCERTGQYPSRCKTCQAFRSTLRKSVSRQSTSNSDRTSASSSTRYCDLTPSEKEERMRNLHDSLKIANQKVKRLQTKVEKLIERQAICVQERDVNDLSIIASEVNSVVEAEFPPDSPQRIFWNQQVKYNRLGNKRQMRWHPLMIRFALNLKYLSSSAYEAVRQTGLINLPSQRTLSDYTHWTTPHSGVQLEFIEHFQSLLKQEVPSEQYHCCLSMDEMTLKSGLVFNKHTGSLCGFADLGSVNHDIEVAISGEDEAQPTQLAEQVFAFLARAVFKPSLSVPVAHYFSVKLKGEKIFPLVWEVVESLEMFDIPVVSLTSDGAKANRRFYRMCQQQQDKHPYKTVNPFQEDKELFFFCDAPHLLKTARNCFSNSFSHSNSRQMQKSGQTISWKWIESLYLMESNTTTPGVRLCHKLTKDHVWLTSYTRMRVNLATQVMSESVATALEYIDNDATQQTRLFIRMINKFFDCLNVKGPHMARLKRNDNIAPYRSPSDERFKWLLKDFLGYLTEWEREISAIPGIKKKEGQRRMLSKETISGLKITVKSFVELGPQLLKLPGVQYLLSEVFSQDPLERYFSRQRHRGGSNENPTACQVPYNAATLVQQQSIYRDLKTMNVESDQPGIKLQVVSQPPPKRPRKRTAL